MRSRTLFGDRERRFRLVEDSAKKQQQKQKRGERKADVSLPDGAQSSHVLLQDETPCGIGTQCSCQ